jgi:hypothetical protein
VDDSAGNVELENGMLDRTQPPRELTGSAAELLKLAQRLAIDVSSEGADEPRVPGTSGDSTAPSGGSDSDEAWRAGIQLAALVQRHLRDAAAVLAGLRVSDDESRRDELMRMSPDELQRGQAQLAHLVQGLVDEYARLHSGQTGEDIDATSGLRADLRLDDALFDLPGDAIDEGNGARRSSSSGAHEGAEVRTSRAAELALARLPALIDTMERSAELLRRAEFRMAVPLQTQILLQLEEFAPLADGSGSSTGAGPSGQQVPGPPSSDAVGEIDGSTAQAPDRQNDEAGEGSQTANELPPGWSRLPAKEQQQARANRADQFVPGYEAFIRAYFDRLGQAQQNRPR